MVTCAKCILLVAQVKTFAVTPIFLLFCYTPNSIYQQMLIYHLCISQIQPLLTISSARQPHTHPNPFQGPAMIPSLSDHKNPWLVLLLLSLLPCTLYSIKHETHHPQKLVNLPFSLKVKAKALAMVQAHPSPPPYLLAWSPTTFPLSTLLHHWPPLKPTDMLPSLQGLPRPSA